MLAINKAACVSHTTRAREGNERQAVLTASWLESYNTTNVCARTAVSLRTRQPRPRHLL